MDSLALKDINERLALLLHQVTHQDLTETWCFSILFLQCFVMLLQLNDITIIPEIDINIHRIILLSTQNGLIGLWVSFISIYYEYKKRMQSTQGQTELWEFLWFCQIYSDKDGLMKQPLIWPISLWTDLILSKIWRGIEGPFVWACHKHGKQNSLPSDSGFAWYWKLKWWLLFQQLNVWI